MALAVLVNHATPLPAHSCTQTTPSRLRLAPSRLPFSSLSPCSIGVQSMTDLGEDLQSGFGEEVVDVHNPGGGYEADVGEKAASCESATSCPFALAQALGVFEKVPRFFSPSTLPTLANTTPPPHSLALLPVRAKHLGTLSQFYKYLDQHIRSSNLFDNGSTSPLFVDRAASATTFDTFRAGLGHGVEAYECVVEDDSADGVAAMRRHLERVEMTRDALPLEWDEDHGAYHTYSSLARIADRLRASDNESERRTSEAYDEVPRLHQRAITLANEPVFCPVDEQPAIPWLKVHSLVSPKGNMKGPSSFSISFTRREVAEGFISPAAPLVSFSAFADAFKRAKDPQAEYQQFLQRTEEINALLGRLTVSLFAGTLLPDVLGALCLRPQHRQANITLYPPRQGTDPAAAATGRSSPPCTSATQTTPSSSDSPLFRGRSASPDLPSQSTAILGLGTATRILLASPRDIVEDLGARFGTLHADDKDDETSWSLLVPLGVLPQGSHMGTFHDPRTGSYIEWDANDLGFYLFRGVDPHVGTPATLPPVYSPHPLGWIYSRSIIVCYPSRAASSPDGPFALDVEQVLTSRSLFHGISTGMRFLGDRVGQAAAGGHEVVLAMLVHSRARHSLAQDVFRRFRLDHYVGLRDIYFPEADDDAAIAVQDEVDRILQEMAARGRSWSDVVQYEASMVRLPSSSTITKTLVDRGNPLGFVTGETSTLWTASAADRRREIAKANEIFRLAASSVVKVRNMVKAARTENGAKFLAARGWRRRVVRTEPPGALERLRELDLLETRIELAQLEAACQLKEGSLAVTYAWSPDPHARPIPPAPPLAQLDHLFSPELLARRSLSPDQWGEYAASLAPVAVDERADPRLEAFALPPVKLVDELANAPVLPAPSIARMPTSSSAPPAPVITITDGVAYHRAPSSVGAVIAAAAARHAGLRSATQASGHEKEKKRPAATEQQRPPKRPRRTIEDLTHVLHGHLVDRISHDISGWEARFDVGKATLDPTALDQVHARLAPLDTDDHVPVSLTRFAPLVDLDLDSLGNLVDSVATSALYARDSANVAVPSSVAGHALCALELDAFARIGQLLRGELGVALRKTASLLCQPGFGGPAGDAIRDHLARKGGVEVAGGARVTVFQSFADLAPPSFGVYQPATAVEPADPPTFEAQATALLIHLFLLSFVCGPVHHATLPWVLAANRRASAASKEDLARSAREGGFAVAQASSRAFLASLIRVRFGSSSAFLLPSVRHIMDRPHLLLDPTNANKQSHCISPAHYFRWESAVTSAFASLEEEGTLERFAARIEPQLDQDIVYQRISEGVDKVLLPFPVAAGVGALPSRQSNDVSLARKGRAKVPNCTPGAKKDRSTGDFVEAVQKLSASGPLEQVKVARNAQSMLNVLLVAAADDVTTLAHAPHRQQPQAGPELAAQIKQAREARARSGVKKEMGLVYNLLRSRPYRHTVRVRLGLIDAAEPVYQAFPPGGLGSIDIDDWLQSPGVAPFYATQYRTGDALTWSRVLLAGDLVKEGFVQAPSRDDMARAVSTVAKGAIHGLAQLGFLRLSPAMSDEQQRSAVERAFSRFYDTLNSSLDPSVKEALRQLDVDVACPLFVENILCKLTRKDWGSRDWIPSNLGWLDLDSPTSAWKLIRNELAAAQPTAQASAAPTAPAHRRQLPVKGKGAGRGAPNWMHRDEETEDNEEEEEDDEEDE
ncbi:hypothetical protein Rhopal_007182-T1 [Rhodotorula paludigena]|uniref:Proteophosphoglycan ppg4 n=1 Tax=Rhodotorula paludigena TaxID=86838 RepID=A0AAV5GV14_9BASI|nr:hypothetical protein Rhopal_007182-T1 [Rhodotorula paludigena]